MLEEFEELASRKENITEADRSQLAKKLYRFVDAQDKKNTGAYVWASIYLASLGLFYYLFRG